jgi:hypothetical protein
MKPGSRKKKPEFSLARQDESLLDLVKTTDHRTLATWAIDCAGRVLPCFEAKFPEDPRPRAALNICREWTTTGIFSMTVIRTASLAAHAAARDVGEDNPARSAAHAAGQAVATAHVPTHSIGAASYAAQALFRAADPGDAEAVAAKERVWQYRHLVALRERSASDS